MNAMKTETRTTTLRTWQERWDSEDATRQWIKRLIGDVKRRSIAGTDGWVIT